MDSSVAQFMDELKTPERKLRTCIVPVCAGERFDLVHKFPNDPVRAENWKTILDVPSIKNLSIDVIRKRYFVCTRHFRPSDYKNIASRGLNKTAYPSINLKELNNLDIIDRNFPEKSTSVYNIQTLSPKTYDEEYLIEPSIGDLINSNASLETEIASNDNSSIRKRKQDFNNVKIPNKYLHIDAVNEEYILGEDEEESNTTGNVVLIENAESIIENVPENEYTLYENDLNLKKMELKHNEDRLIAIAEYDQHDIVHDKIHNKDYNNDNLNEKIEGSIAH